MIINLTYYHVAKDVPEISLDIAVVIDVLRATTTISWALKNGADSIQVFADLDLLLVSTGDGFYVPSYNVDQIGEINQTDGFNVFLNGGDSQVLSLDGSPVDASQVITLEAYTMNLLPYLLLLIIL